MKIILDAMGGDHAPQAAVEGALAAHARTGVQIALVGREEAIRNCLTAPLPEGMEIVNAAEVVEISDDPATAFKKKKDSSLTVGLTMLKNGEGDAFVSAGSTGALLAGATLLTKRIRGIRRAAMGPVIPTAAGKALLCDCGATADCTAEYLLQFAYLGNFYAQRLMGIQRPRVGLLNIGAEPSKGDALRHEAFALLEKAGQEGRLHFVGNIEANAAMMGAADVIVADGYSGNILLKSVEGAAVLLMQELKKSFSASAKSKLGALLLKDSLREVKRMMDPNEVGATPFLGISKPVLKAHGSSNAYAMENAVLRAMEYAQSGLIAEVETHIGEMCVDRAT